jgi:hypothetical protein
MGPDATRRPQIMKDGFLSEMLDALTLIIQNRKPSIAILAYLGPTVESS